MSVPRLEGIPVPVELWPKPWTDLVTCVSYPASESGTEIQMYASHPTGGLHYVRMVHPKQPGDLTDDDFVDVRKKLIGMFEELWP